MEIAEDIAQLAGGWILKTNRLTWMIFADSLYGVVGM